MHFKLEIIHTVQLVHLSTIQRKVECRRLIWSPVSAIPMPLQHHIGDVFFSFFWQTLSYLKLA